MPPNTHTLRHASAPAVRPRAPDGEPLPSRLDDGSRSDEDSRLDDDAMRPGEALSRGDESRDSGDPRVDDEALLARYAALVRRAHALFGEPMPAPALVPEAIVRELEDAAHRLGPHVSAMPGARALSSAEYHALRAFEAMLESDAARFPAAKPAP